MNESITRAAGAVHGQEMTVDDMRELADSLGRVLVRRTTLYGQHNGDGPSCYLDARMPSAVSKEAAAPVA
jgi:hypothetical protein